MKLKDYAIAYGSVIQIKEICEESVITTDNEEICLSEIRPLKIGTEDDRHIYLCGVIPVALNAYARNGIPVDISPYKYMEYEDIIEIVKEKGFTYVHELQHWLSDTGSDYFLEERY